MRYIANIPQATSDIKRLMIYASGRDIYLFAFDQLEDAPSKYDWLSVAEAGKEWEAIEDVMQDCLEKYGVSLDSWQAIDDAKEGDKVDRINSMKHRSTIGGKGQNLQWLIWVLLAVAIVVVWKLIV